MGHALRSPKLQGGLLLAFALAGGCSDWEAPVDPDPSSGGMLATAGGGASGGGGASSGGQSMGGDGGARCDRTAEPKDAYPAGLRAVGGHIEDADGNQIVLHGVNRSGSEYACVQGKGVFDGPSDEASVRAIAAWNVNAVRVPLNESCWLGINGAPAEYSGENYRKAIRDYVALLHKYAVVPILDLHWAAPGELRATKLLPLPNVDHSLDFWRDVATAYMDDTGVVLEPYNEPFPDSNRDTVTAWACWRDGCTVRERHDQSVPPNVIWPEYTAAGMQAIVDAIRDVGAEHLILLGGVQYSNSLFRWLEYQPIDPLANVGAAWHVYNFNGCSYASCWEAAPSAVAQVVPVVATEIGEDTCGGTFIDPLMQFLDGMSSGYLAWSWNAYGACVPADPDLDKPGQPWPLIKNYNCPEPNSDYARAFFDHIAAQAK